jgi:ketosteroid isomerase-like protein
MSEQNLEVVRRSLDAFDRNDRATWLALRDLEYEVIPSATWPEVGAIRGPEAGWDFYLKVTEQFERPTFSGDVDLWDVDADTVLAHHRNRVRGGASGVDIELDYWVVATFREGKVFRDQWFTDRARALEAAGLSE